MQAQRRLLRQVLPPITAADKDPDPAGVLPPLYEKFKEVLGSGRDQLTATIDLTGTEIDYLNRRYLGYIKGWQETKPEDVSNEELVGITDEARDFIEQVRARKPGRLTESRGMFMELNLAWNRTGGTPRPEFLKFQETDSSES